MIKHYTLAALQRAMNQALSLDKSVSEKIKPLQGKIINVVILPLQVSFFLRFKDYYLELLEEYEGYVDTTIRSTPLGLIRLSLLPASKVRSLFNDRIQMTGDVELGQKVKKLFDGLEIDWEGHLAEFTGDVVAHQIGKVVRKGFSWKKQIQHVLGNNLSEYIQYELGLTPPREEIEDFFKDVDELKLKVERLAAHIERILGDHETH